MAAGSAVTVVAIAVTSGLLLSAGRPSVPTALKPLPGRILALSSNGAMVSVNPASGEVNKVPVPAGGAPVPIAMSSDGKVLLSGQGRVFGIAGGVPVPGSNAVSPTLSPASVPAPSMPFGDHDQTVLILSRPTAGSAARATMVNLNGGGQSDIGLIGYGAADPQSTGAFVSVPAQTIQPHRAHPASSDLRLELRVPGQAAVTVATTAQLRVEIGSLPSTPIQLSIDPDPTGSAIAVTLNPILAIDRSVPLVLLNRHGELIAKFAGTAGPIYNSQPVWSPDGRQLAYPTYTNAGAALAISTLTGTTRDFLAPPSTTFGRCVWSPDSTDVVCQAQSAARAYQWQYATPASSSFVSVESSGDPLAWIASSQSLARSGECRTLDPALCNRRSG